MPHNSNSINIYRPAHTKICLTPIFFFAVTIILNSLIPAQAQLTYTHLAAQYEKPWTCGRLQLIPIRFKDTGNGQKDFINEQNSLVSGNIISFEKAMRQGKVSVKETNTSGGDDVSLLEIRNRSRTNIVVNSGEIVSGGMQDRAFAATMVIPPDRHKHYLPVFCIEKGRWGKKSKTSSFRYAGSVDASVRKQMDVSKKQNKVWKEIDKLLADNHIRSTTKAYLDLYKDTGKVDTSCIYFFRQKILEGENDYAGFVAITGDRIINCELFANPNLCIASFETLLKGYMRSITEFDTHPDVSKAEVKDFLDKFMQTEEQQKKYLDKNGRLYLKNGKPLHLIAYTE